MNRRIASIAIVASLLLAVGACSKSNDTTQTNTTQAQSATTAGKTDSTKGESSDTKKPTDTKATGTTRGSTGTTSRSTGTTTGGGGGLQFTASQKQCIETAAQALKESNPEAAQIIEEIGSSNGAALTAAQAAVVGGLIVGCVPKTDLVDALVSGLKNSPEGKNISSDGLECIGKQILALDSEELALFIAVIVVAGQSGDKSIAAPAISKLNQACNTNIPA